MRRWWSGTPWSRDSDGGGRAGEDEGLASALDAAFAPERWPGDGQQDLARRREKWAATLHRFQVYGHFSVGNRVTVLEGGDVCFPEMLAAIAGAQKRVWLGSYIFDGSPTARDFTEALAEAARRGCEVVLLVDYIGAFGMPQPWLSELRAAGAEVVVFNPLLPASAGVGPVTFRDHRKIAICDEVGFCGGMNIHDAVLETPRTGAKRFYDVHAKLEGPCVSDLAEVLRDSLRETGSDVAPHPLEAPPPIPGGVYVQILQSNVRQRRRSLQEVIESAIDAADKCVYLTTAYFFPPGFLRRALQRVPERGVQLSLLLTGNSDFYPIPGDLMAQTHFLRRFLRATQSYRDLVKVHLYEPKHMHAKHMSVDGIFSTIGSFNFDLYSARRNLEVGVAVLDSGVAHRLQAMHEARASEARPSALEDWAYSSPAVRAACAIAYGCIRLSGRNIFDGFDCFQRKWLMRKAALTFQLEEQAASFVAGSMMWGL